MVTTATYRSMASAPEAEAERRESFGGMNNAMDAVTETETGTTTETGTMAATGTNRYLTKLAT